MMTAVSLPYHEPGLENILVLATFLLALTPVNAVLVVFEGGMASSLPTMRRNLALSFGVAAPMGLSFLLGLVAAAAALCSTSPGTTLTVLSTSGLASTRLGSVPTTAAMMDDVVGLVMVQIVSAGLGGDGGGTGDIAASPTRY